MSHDPGQSDSGADTFCIRCGYDLRATPVDGSCPECGAPFEWSAWAGTANGERWRRQVRRGAMVLSGTLGGQLVAAVLWYVLMVQALWFPSHWVYWAVDSAFNGLWLAGTLYITSTWPIAIEAESRVSVRRVARYLMLVGTIGVCAMPLIQILLSKVAYDYWFYDRPVAAAVVESLQSQLESVFKVVSFIALCALAKHVVAVAGWLRFERLKQHARIAWYGSVGTGILSQAFSMAMWLPIPGGPLIDPMSTTIPIQAISICLGIAMLLMSVWVLIVLAWMARWLSRSP